MKRARLESAQDQHRVHGEKLEDTETPEGTFPQRRRGRREKKEATQGILRRLLFVIRKGDAVGEIAAGG